MVTPRSPWRLNAPRKKTQEFEVVWIGSRRADVRSLGHVWRVFVRTLFSTSDVHPRDGYDYWHEILCKKVIEHDCIPQCRRTFRAELQAGAIADIALLHYESSPMYCSATAHHAAHANAEELFVVRQGAGVTVIEQDGREAALEAGDITLVDPRRPMAAKYFKGSKILILKVPRRQLEARIGKTLQMTALSIKPLEEHALTSAFLAMLPTHTDMLSAAAADIVRDQALDLAAVSLAKAMDRGRPLVSSARSLALVSVRAAIEARLADPALDSETVAAAAGVSVRYANAVLADDGTSIMRLVQARRLERCRRALQDPSQAARTVSEIAYGWGFSDMTHFGRRFRAAYGLLPSEYRAQFEEALLQLSRNAEGDARP
jgi:AraC-like DNA-binding protein/mannose-6-phosphate isomerase-like protein (cupin superfamily)